MPPALLFHPYKEFLTPALHRRFTTASVTLLGLCYTEAILIGQWDSFLWSWFPFGPASIRTGLLFICAFSIFVLRVGQLHVGLRTTNSPFQTFQRYAFRSQTIQTAGWYLFSAWLFSEVYIFSAPSGANIGWITDSRNGERPKLNERPIYLTSYLIMLAVVQTGFHLFYDYDQVDMPVTKTKSESASNQQVHLVMVPSVQVKTVFPALVASALKRTLLMTMAGPLIYSMTIRHTAWNWTLTFAKMFWSLPRSTALPAIAPFHFKVLGRTFTAGFLLIMMWEIGNAGFSVYVAQEPLKNERPITYESRDPNGSLLTGLKGKKLHTRAFAFWELALIAQRFQGRRKSIFEEIDRKGGSTWSQISEVCLDIINGINTRIAEYEAPPAAPATVPQRDDDPGLPRLAPPLKEDNIYSASSTSKSRGASIAQTISSIAKSHGQSPSHSPALKVINQARSMMPLKKKTQPSPGTTTVVNPYALRFLQSPIGWPFRQEFRRRIAFVVLGSPYGSLSIIVDAIDSLTRLSVCSLKEDPYGNVHKDVANIIRTFTATIAKLEGFKRSLGIHWTDVKKKQESPEVDTILTALKGGLQKLLAAFGSYSEDLRLSPIEMREAQMAATSRVVEMKER